MQPDIPEFTPEQRRLLGKAYRLILSWDRKKAGPKSAAVDHANSQACDSGDTLSPDLIKLFKEGAFND